VRPTPAERPVPFLFRECSLSPTGPARKKKGKGREKKRGKRGELLILLLETLLSSNGSSYRKLLPEERGGERGEQPSILSRLSYSVVTSLYAPEERGGGGRKKKKKGGGKRGPRPLYSDGYCLYYRRGKKGERGRGKKEGILSPPLL